MLALPDRSEVEERERDGLLELVDELAAEEDVRDMRLHSVAPRRGVGRDVRQERHDALLLGVRGHVRMLRR
jgi:hypothetical protein